MAEGKSSLNSHPLHVALKEVEDPGLERVGNRVTSTDFYHDAVRGLWSVSGTTARHREGRHVESPREATSSVGVESGYASASFLRIFSALACSQVSPSRSRSRGSARLPRRGEVDAFGGHARVLRMLAAPFLVHLLYVAALERVEAVNGRAERTSRSRSNSIQQLNRWLFLPPPSSSNVCERRTTSRAVQKQRTTLLQRRGQELLRRLSEVEGEPLPIFVAAALLTFSPRSR